MADRSFLFSSASVDSRSSTCERKTRSVHRCRSHELDNSNQLFLVSLLSLSLSLSYSLSLSLSLLLSLSLSLSFETDTSFVLLLLFPFVLRPSASAIVESDQLWPGLAALTHAGATSELQATLVGWHHFVSVALAEKKTGEAGKEIWKLFSKEKNEWDRERKLSTRARIPLSLSLSLPLSLSPSLSLSLSLCPSLSLSLSLYLSLSLFLSLSLSLSLSFSLRVTAEPTHIAMVILGSTWFWRHRVMWRHFSWSLCTRLL